MSGSAAEAGERMRRARRAGDGDPGGKAEPAAESEDALAHPLLAAEQMGDAGQIEPQPVGPETAARGVQRRAANRPSRASKAASPSRIGGADVEAGNQGARLGERHAGQRPSARAAGQAAATTSRLPIAMGGDQSAFAPKRSV